MATSTKKTQGSNWKNFVNFCQLFNLEYLPATESTLILFVTYKTVALGHSVSSTRNSLSTIRRCHLSSGFVMSTPNECFPLREALRGAQRFLSRPSVQKLPMFPALISALVASTEWGSPWRCLFLMLWCTFARLASLIPTVTPYSPSSHLSWGDITFHSHAVRIVFKKTKTIQCKERYLQFVIPEHANKSICLFTQLKAWFMATPCKQSTDPVFLIFHFGVYQPLNRKMADPVLKSAIATLGLDASKYGWSSFRRGGATSGFLATGDVEALREHGDWKSNAYTRYLALPASKRTHIVSALQGLL